ncbi:MAG TPA: pyridoxal kinase PdxY [Azospirillaceae bacterium]|nr:pyridoxal kinase PdxY [Azospirillaceae bacterium]
MTGSILSIQSHVAYGYVGNRAAAFPLQRLGREVIAVNTVQFSNHTGYGAWRGDVAAPLHVREVLSGVEERGGFDACDAALSGYLGDAALGEAVLAAVTALKRRRPQAVYCCDPVMGDVGRGFFVRPGVPEFMRDQAVPAADIVTPNHFELEALTGAAVHTLDDALAATAALRALGPSVVLVTSLARRGGAENEIEMLADGPAGAFLIAAPRLPFDTPPNGGGDLTAALFLAHWLGRRDAAAALEATAAAVHQVFAETARRGGRELQIVAAQDAYVSAARPFVARRLTPAL